MKVEGKGELVALLLALAELVDLLPCDDT